MGLGQRTCGRPVHALTQKLFSISPIYSSQTNMRPIDLNADTGEADTPEWQAIEAAVLKHVTSANIACGGHAGDHDSMSRTVKLAKSNGINIGAHPAYPDKANFGRKSLSLGDDISYKNLALTLTEQIKTLEEIAADNGTSISYVKAHGALYNDAVFNPQLAGLIAEVVADLNPNLWLMGAPSSCLTKAAQDAGLKFVAEGFIDRRYTDDGHLQSRKEAGAVIESNSDREAQALALWQGQNITTNTGKALNLQVQTLCLHSDSPGADITAAKIKHALLDQGAKIEPFINAA